MVLYFVLVLYEFTISSLRIQNVSLSISMSLSLDVSLSKILSNIFISCLENLAEAAIQGCS